MLRPTMEPNDNEQLLLRPSRELVNKLTDLTRRFRKTSTRNKVAVEILEDYLDVWAETEQSKLDAQVQHKEALARAIKAEKLRRPMLREAEAEPVDKPQAHGKKGNR